MRVVTQLIDTQTGADVWSMRFDRLPGDIFEVQDEIAVQVTQALELSLDARAKDRLTGQGTQNLQGPSRLSAGFEPAGQQPRRRHKRGDWTIRRSDQARFEVRRRLCQPRGCVARRRDGRGRRLLAEAIARTNHEIREQRRPAL
jgi:hypothetical protein